MSQWTLQCWRGTSPGLKSCRIVILEASSNAENNHVTKTQVQLLSQLLAPFTVGNLSHATVCACHPCLQEATGKLL